MNELLSDKQIKVTVTEPAVDYIIEKGFDAKMGARPLARKIAELIKVPLSKKILFENIPNGSKITVDYDSEIHFTVDQPDMTMFQSPNVVDENGYSTLD